MLRTVTAFLAGIVFMPISMTATGTRAITIELAPKLQLPSCKDDAPTLMSDKAPNFHVTFPWTPKVETGRYTNEPMGKLIAFLGCCYLETAM